MGIALAAASADEPLEQQLCDYQQSLRSCRDSNPKVYDYLTTVKGYTAKDLEIMDLGYCAKRDAVVIPVKCHGTLRGFIFQQPHSKERDESFNDVLICLPMGTTNRDRDLILVADPLDALRLQTIKLFDVAATGSASLTHTQVTLIKQFNPQRVILVRGKDTVAKELEADVKQHFSKVVIPLSVVVLDAKDVSDFLKTNSKEDLITAIGAARSSVLDHTASSASELFALLAAQPPPLQTGYKKLDTRVQIAVGAMTIIAGRPKHGKTTFLYNLMMQMVESKLYADKKFFFFSYEESGIRIKQKMLCRLIAANGANASKLAAAQKWDIKSFGDLIQRYAKERRDDPSYPSIPEIAAAESELTALLSSVKIVAEPHSVEELGRVIRELNEREDVGAIFIDYIQRIPSEKKTNSIREDINHVSNTLRRCAVETNLPLIVGAQINRGATDKARPAQGDLKESGALEEDANQVLCVYNESQGAADSSKGAQIGGQQAVEVYTLCSRDTGHSTTKFVLTDRLFREA